MDIKKNFEKSRNLYRRIDKVRLGLATAIVLLAIVATHYEWLAMPDRNKALASYGVIVVFLLLLAAAATSALDGRRWIPLRVACMMAALFGVAIVAVNFPNIIKAFDWTNFWQASLIVVVILAVIVALCWICLRDTARKSKR